MYRGKCSASVPRSMSASGTTDSESEVTFTSIVTTVSPLDGSPLASSPPSPPEAGSDDDAVTD